jgi:hypothetical protein
MPPPGPIGRYPRGLEAITPLSTAAPHQPLPLKVPQAIGGEVAERKLAAVDWHWEDEDKHKLCFNNQTSWRSKQA